MNGLIEGRIVHYVAYNNRHLAAIVIGVDTLTTGQVNVAVFSDMKNVNGGTNMGITFQAGILYSEDMEPGTWHWIERA